MYRDRTYSTDRITDAPIHGRVMLVCVRRKGRVPVLS